MDRIELLFQAADKIAQAVLASRIPMAVPELDPLAEFEHVSWPETWERYKAKVKEAEKMLGREPLTTHQWWAVETYLRTQYGLELPPF